MDLVVTPAVLIPRPETEHVIETVLELGKASPQTPTNLRIVDVGTGSGCIALALARELPDAEIHATDISGAALEIARANASRHQLDTRIHFHETNLLAGLSGQFDFVVSNPPYVGEWETETVEAQVRKFEPKQAVFGGQTGLEVIRDLIPHAYRALKPGGWLVMEIGHSSYEQVREALKEWQEVSATKDLKGIRRVIVARR